MIGLATIAIADGNYKESEHALLVAIGSGFGFNSHDLEHILTLVGIRPAFRQKKQDKHIDSSVDEEYHLAVLGLKFGATLPEIKTAFRRLARQHHPDHLQACGVPLGEIKRREDLLKTINSSYDWLIRRQNAA